MKIYKVFFHPEARAEAIAAAEYIARTALLNARRWYAGLEKAMDSLRSMPRRCGMAREKKYLPGDVRQFIYKSHRIIFRVDERAGTVRVLHIRHAARRTIGEP